MRKSHTLTNSTNTHSYAHTRPNKRTLVSEVKHDWNTKLGIRSLIKLIIKVFNSRLQNTSNTSGTGYLDVFWSIGSQIDEGDTFLFTPGV